MADIDRVRKDETDPEIPTGYEPHYGYRDFDQAQVHRNGTWYDDEGYDAYFLDKDGNLRPDKIPPFDGAYGLGILAAVQHALDMAVGLVDIETRHDVCGDPSFKLVVQTEPSLVSEQIACDRWDYREYGTSLSDIPVSAMRFDVSFGGIVIADPEGAASLDGGSPLGIGYHALWDEHTGKPLVDPSDFVAALGQLGKRMVANARDWREQHQDEDTYADCLELAGRLLGIGRLWAFTEPRRWAERGLGRADWTGTLSLWNDGVARLRAEVAEREAAKRAAYEASLSDDVPF